MKKTFTPALALWFASGLAGFAQLAGPPSLGLDFGLLSKLFGDTTAFSAKAEVQVFDKNQKEKMNAPLDFAMLDNNVRVEMETARIKNKDMPDGAAAMLKQFGLDRVTSIIRPDKKTIYLIIPSQQSLVATPMPQPDVDVFYSKPKIEKAELGKETLDGHPCVKNKVVFTGDKGEKHECTVWYATDLKNFPVQILTQEKDDTVILRYRQVQLAKPAAKQFDVPTGYQEYTDVQAMMQGVAMKMMSGGGVPAR